MKLYRLKLSYLKKHRGINKAKYGVRIVVALFGLFFWKFVRYNREFWFNTAQARDSFLKRELGLAPKKHK